MPLNKYIKLLIDGEQIDMDSIDELPISVSYKLEDKEDFQQKTSSSSLNIKTPATKNNNKIFNSAFNPSIADLTANTNFKNWRSCLIEANGQELLIGKSKMESVSHNRNPLEYTISCYGNNADWVIDLKEATFYEFLKQINFPYTKSNIEASWAFNGTSENLPYVFAPVRYRQPMGGKILAANGELVADDNNMKPTYMKPSLSIYWLLYWGLKSVGYKIQSNFFDTDYFRRMTMLWTWGNFLDSDGTRLNTHKFLAKSVIDHYIDYDFNGIWDLGVSNDSTNGAFDNNNDYSYTTPTMVWQYKVPHYGTLDTTLSILIDVDAKVDMGTTFGSAKNEMRVKWFKNGVQFDGGWGAYNGNGNFVYSLGSSGLSANYFTEQVELFCNTQVNNTDNAGAGTIITAQIYFYNRKPKGGAAHCRANVLQFKLDFFKIPLGGTIDFQNYLGFQKYKWMDLLRGVIDTFNLSVQTDPTTKMVYFEPTHPYSLTNDLGVKQGGYFNGDYLLWHQKQDLSKTSTIQLYSDYEREVIFRFKDDGNDGGLKVVQDRNITKLAAGKYVLPDRFKTGNKEFENRFFSPTIHYDVAQWKDLPGGGNISPQMICLIPENISNTSQSESENTFIPKLAYYKGLQNGVGAWRWDGNILTQYPFLFAVNYKIGGENDPILSYGDEKIGNDLVFTIGKGLLKRFYWQRLAIMRNGQFYKTYFQLNNKDVTNWLHREHIVLAGQKWELIEINNYKPLLEESTEVEMRKFEPIAEIDNTNSFPSNSSISSNILLSDKFDTKYSRLICLNTDIPN